MDDSKRKQELFSFGSKEAAEKKRKRTQRVYTPGWMVNRLHRLWERQGGILEDPCSSPEKWTRAAAHYYPEHPSQFDGLERGSFGFCSYANPPFNNLKPWMRAWSRSWESVILVPTRAHRRWWRTYANQASAWVDLDAFAFHGRTGTFPLPCRLMYRGDLTVQFAEIFGDRGDASYGVAYTHPRRQCDIAFV